MNSTHLPPWGPYSKYLAGACHIGDIERGTRMECSFFPGLHRRCQSLPVHLWDCGFAPWRAAPDLRHWSFRFPPDPAPDLLTDISYLRDGTGLEITATFHNGSNHPQIAALHGLLCRRDPEQGPSRQPSAIPLGIFDIEKNRWHCAAAYSSIRFNQTRPDRQLPTDARPVGVIWRHDLVDGRGLGDGFGRTPGDEVSYHSLPAADKLLLRYRVSSELRLQLTGMTDADCPLRPHSDFRCLELPLPRPRAGSLTLRSPGGADLELDGFALLNASDPPPRFAPAYPDTPPLLDLNENTLRLQYPGDSGDYRLSWPADTPPTLRRIHSDNLSVDFPLSIHEHVKTVIGTPGEQHYTHLAWSPLPLSPGQSITFRLQLSTSIPTPPAFKATPVPELPAAPAGIERLRATLLTNLVFPVQYKREYLIHHCPGKFWDSLYTWDSGFIGLGMSTLHPPLAEEILDRYLARPEDDFAYVHHGSPVPVQLHLLHSLFNQSDGDLSLLERHFDRACRMYRFLAGRAEGSATSPFQSGLPTPFPYFYNSGGWDDYPAQCEVHRRQVADRASPVITGAQLIRCAKLLKGMAGILERDIGEFDQDIQILGHALFEHAWNENTRWFSYVLHDNAGRPVGPLLREDCGDFNTGLDGLYPLVAGICPPALEAEFLDRLRDPDRFWSDAGLSTVDMKSPLYKPNGYWNGAVWMPHQWFFWKYLLDIGQGDFALAIARRALELWEREAGVSGRCFEHFPIQTGRGAGWHHFGGLSAPVLLWHAALHRPGQLSGGYQCWILSRQYRPGHLRADLRFDGRPDDQPEVWIVFPSTTPPQLEWTGSGTPVCTRDHDLCRLRFPCGTDRGILSLRTVPPSS